MTIWRRKYLLPCLILTAPLALHAQGPRGGFSPWWDGPIVSGLDLTDAQRSEILSVTREYRGRLLEVRDAVQKAESALDGVFNEDTVDQRRGSEAIDRLTRARADMTRAVSEMSLRMRAVLTPQQWQELRQREQRMENAGRGPGPGPGPGRGPGRGRRVAKAAPKGDPRDGQKDLPARADSQAQTPPPALNQQ